MTENVVLGLLGFLQAIMLALIGKIGFSVSRARKQVENDHIKEDGTPYNLRDNIDNNQAETVRALSRLEGTIKLVLGDVTGIKKDVGRLDDRDLERSREQREFGKTLSGVSQRLETHLHESTNQNQRLKEVERLVNAT